MAKLRLIPCSFMVIALVVFGLGFGPRPIIAAERKTPVPDEDIQALASGPIHEAFAQAVVLDAEPGIVAPREPPALIDEIPPEQKPEGDVQWIPGYWAWDDARDEYIWVSGIWRVLPPGRQWVPGYWVHVSEGYQWISGYWASANEREIEYLPEPPESVEVGPSSNAPSSDYTWIPGSWVWNYGRYAWRPGYWAFMNPDWIWMPDHYIWTRRGYIFVGGYWDYPVIHRGVLFAPVFIPLRLRHLGLTFSFSPGFVIDLSVFDEDLFLRPRYHHYYYGHYYAPEYYRRGIYPWFSLHARRVVYDPIYAHQRWKHRRDSQWENRLQKRFRTRRKLEGSQPLRTFDRSTGRDNIRRSSGPARRDFVMPLNRAGKTMGGVYRFKPLSEKQRKESSRREKEVRTYQKERQSREIQRRTVPEDKVSRRPRSDKEKFSKSPIMDRSDQRTRRRKAPPARYKAPKTNPDVEPLQRRNDLLRSRDKPQKSKDTQRNSGVRRQRSTDEGRKSGNQGRQLQNRTQYENDRQQRQDDGPQRRNGR